MFVIEDNSHCEWMGEFVTREAALEEIQRLATVPWDQQPNQAPCMSWRTCGRRYDIIECDDSAEPWRQLSVTPAFEISANGVVWL